MAPKSTQSSRAPASAALEPLAFYHSSGHEHHRRNLPQPGLPVHAPAGSATPSTKQKGGAGSTRSSSSDDEEANVSDAAATEADEDEGEDKDGDALAPSGRAMDGHGDQAGLTGIKDANDEECESDDEAYNGVNLISDSEEEDSDLMKKEERNIIESEANDIHNIPATVPTSATEASDEWPGFDLDYGLFSTDISHFDEQYGRSEPSILEGEMEIFRSASVFEDFDPMPSFPPSSALRRVRFEEPVSHRSDSSDIVSDDEGLDGLFNNAPTYTGEDLAFGVQDDEEDDASSAGNSSGYETDYGENTDEEEIPASATTKPQSLLRQPSLSSLDNDSQISSSAAPSPFKVPAAPVRHSRGPRMGSWTVDRTKPFAVIDATGDNMVIVPAKRPATDGGMSRHSDLGMANTTNTSPIATQPTLAPAIGDVEIDYSDFSFHADPMLASEPDVMPSTLLPTAPSSQVPDQTFPSSSVFFPMDDIGDVNAVYAVDDQDDEDDDDEDLLKIEDFIDFGVSSEDEGDEDLDHPQNMSLPTPVSTSPSGTGAHLQSTKPSPENSTAHHLLKHLDKSKIGAFRRGQPHHQAHLHRAQGGSSLNSHAFKGGRQAAAHSSLSTQKKRKVSDACGGHQPFGATAKRRLSNRR